MRQIDLKDAYNVLGLPEDASLEEVKNSYKKLALQFHPDKNISPDATERFQEIGAAYSRVVKHIENPGHGEGHYWDEDGDDGDEMDLDFFMYMFSRMFAGAQARRAGGPHPFMSSSMFAEREERRRQAEEADRAAYFAERKERNLQAQLAAQKKEAERLERQKEEEIRWAKERIQLKKMKKDGRAKAQEQQKQTVLETRRASQKKRSEVFKFARSGDAESVKKGIWEQNVDAAGGECLVGMKDDPIFSASWRKVDYDLNETFLHIFSRSGELDMVKWLIDHNAEVEERDSWNRTAFHVALQHGDMATMSFFVETFPPESEDSLPIFEPPKPLSHPSREYSLLRLAMDSLSPSAVRFIITNHLFDRSELEEAWNYITGEGRAGPGKGYADELAGRAKISTDEKLQRAWSSIRDQLKKQGNFEISMPPPPPPTLPTPARSPDREIESTVHPHELAGHSNVQEDPLFQKKKKKTKKPKKNANKPDSSQRPAQPESPSVQHAATSQTNPETSKSETTPLMGADKSAESLSALSARKAQVDSLKLNAQNMRKAENAYPSPTSGYPSSPEATARHEHFHDYSNNPQQAREPSRAHQRTQSHNKHSSTNLGDRLTDAGRGASVLEPNSGSGLYQPAATAQSTRDIKSDAKGEPRTTGTHAEKAAPIHTSNSSNTTDSGGNSRPGDTNGVGEGARGRAVFRKARRGRGANSTYDGNGAAKESTGGGHGKGRGTGANGATGGSERRFGDAEGGRGRGYRGRGGRGRGGSARGHAAGRGAVTEPVV